jgi:hypothetical protein
MGFVVDEVALGHFGFLANSHSTDCSTFIIIYDPWLVPISG